MDYIEKALEMGAKYAVSFSMDDIVFDSRVILNKYNGVHHIETGRLRIAEVISRYL